MYRILVVEDDSIISNTIIDNLNKWGYVAEGIDDFSNVLSTFASFNPHIILMDISLPFFNGYHWCSEIRKISSVPIIFISSISDNMNIIMAMNMGGDDFIVKPFDLNVLIAKVQAMIRRTYSFSESTSIYEHKGGMLNLNDQTFMFDNNKIDLSKNEYRILQMLMQSVGKVVSREKIMENLWENESFVDDNTLTVNVTRLRKKLDDAGLKDFIKTKKGIGYIIE